MWCSSSESCRRPFQPKPVSYLSALPLWRQIRSESQTKDVEISLKCFPRTSQVTLNLGILVFWPFPSQYLQRIPRSNPTHLLSALSLVVCHMTISMNEDWHWYLLGTPPLRPFKVALQQIQSLLWLCRIHRLQEIFQHGVSFLG
jgi:hypothetical protein